MNDDGKRPWWMLHWPSWLTLVAVGAVMFLTNVIPSLPEESIVYIQRNRYGWPWSYACTSWIYSDIQWVFFMDQIMWWSWTRLFMDVLVGVIVTIAAVGQIEVLCVRLRVRWTISAIMGLTGTAAIVTLSTMLLPGWVFENDARVCLLITPIRVFSAGIGVYWLVSSALVLVDSVSRAVRRSVS